MASKPKTNELLVLLKQLPSNSILTEFEASVFLGISQSTLARRRRAGIGPPYFKGDRANSSIQYRKGDL